MRPGPKWELDRQAVIDNIRLVANRLGVTALSKRQYNREGSFHADSIAQKFGWANIVRSAGLSVGKDGKVRGKRRPCIQACGRISMADAHLCRDCCRRIARHSRFVIDNN